MGKGKRERDRALAMGADAAYGRYVRFACPAYSHAWIFFGPFTVASGWATALDLVHIVRGEGGMLHGWFVPLGVASTLLMGYGLFTDVIERRVGGPTPRLYCFQHGVVVATRGVLRAYRWTELTIDRQKWERGTGDGLDTGTRSTVKAQDGRVVVVFEGNEPGRAGGWEMEQLHKAATRGRGTPAPVTSSTPHPRRTPPRPPYRKPASGRQGSLNRARGRRRRRRR